MLVVLDRSVTMAWCFDDEASAERLAAPLATLDAKLRTACHVAGVPLVIGN